MAQQAVTRPAPLTMTGAFSAQERLRLHSLDGLRALAALAVVLVHAFEIYGLGVPDVGNPSGNLGDSPAHQLIRGLYEWFFVLGALAVPVFIALSGYSLMIPLARSGRGLGGRALSQFFYRRLRRIVPPYYAAMVLSLLIIWLIPGMAEPANVYWDRALRDLDLANIGAHLLLVHNYLGRDWLSGINPPFWSLAVEWQIYFLFPVLVVLWRRLGLLPMLLIAGIYSQIPLRLPITLLPLSHPSYVVLFAIGMAGAVISFASGGLAKVLHDRLPYGALAAAALAGFFGLHALRVATGSGDGGLLLELLITAAVVALVIAGTKSQRLARNFLAERVLGSRVLRHLGSYSYSLYLVHMPVLAVLALAARGAALPTTASYLLMIGLGLPLSLLAAYGFHLLFERPFLGLPGTERRSAPA